MLDMASYHKCLRFYTLNLVSVTNIAIQQCSRVRHKTCAGFIVSISQKTEALGCTRPSAGAAP